MRSVPSARDDDTSPEMVAERRRFVEEHSGVRLEHLARGSIDPRLTRGNIENFTGVAQVPLGFAGPLRVKGSTRRASS